MAAFDVLEEDLLYDLDANTAYVERFLHSHALFSVDHVMSVPCAQTFFDGPLEEYYTSDMCCLRDELKRSFVARVGETVIARASGMQVYKAPRV